MKRPLTLFERGLYLDGRVPVTIVLPARIQGHLAEQQLRHALSRLQGKHPLLRCLIVQEEGRPWFQLQAQAPPIPLRIVERRTDTDWQEESTRECEQLFDAGRDPLIRLVWLRGQHVGELLLVCHHCICDGRSIVTLLREILLLCDRPDQDIGIHTSLNAIEEILPEEIQRNRHLQRRMRWKAALFKAFMRAMPIGPAMAYGKAYVIRSTIDRRTSQSLAQRCKAEGVTVFNALCVAFVLSFRSARDARSVGKFSVPVDVRKFLPKLKADSLFAIAPTVALSLSTPRSGEASGAEFWMLARALKADLGRKIDRLGTKVYENLLGMEHLHALFDRLIAFSRSRPSGRNVTLSYLGRLDIAETYRDLRLEAIFSPSAMLAPTPATLIAITRFADRMDFSFTSDELSLPYTQALTIKEEAMRILHAHARAGLPTEPEAPIKCATSPLHTEPVQATPILAEPILAEPILAEPIRVEPV